MWWYRDREKKPGPGTAEGAATQAPSEELAVPARILAEALPADPTALDGLCAMSVLVDRRLVLGDGTEHGPHTWQDAERHVTSALPPGTAPRLYNEFARGFGDGCSLRDDLPEDEAAAMRAVLEAIASHPDVASIDAP